ncbi:MAG: BTAD domain-containing putative transcriptional regulator, partial [Vallitaleaceae bacterium]|nr:BTAD domain-containing putative transcriptional regulator [Vallitaleaceae bacterium]
RERIPLTDPKICTNRSVAYFSYTDLLFTREELIIYMDKRGIDHTEKVVDVLVKHTGGWIAAINLLLLFYIPDINKSITDIASLTSYVESEILGRLPKETKTFLIETSLFDVLESVICDSYLGMNNSKQIMAELADKHFLLYAIEEGVYKLHDLIRDILISMIEPEGTQYKKAAEAYTYNDRPIQSIDYLLTAGLYDDGQVMMEKFVPELIKKGNWVTISRWLNCFDDQIIVRNPFLCITTAELKVYHASVYEAEKYLHMAQKLYNKADDHIGHARCLNVAARILRSQGKYEASLDKMSDAMALLAGERFDISMETALSYLFIGDFARVENTLNNAYDKALDTMDDGMIAHIVACMAHFNYLKGDYTNAVSLYKKAETYSDGVYDSHFQRSCLASIYQDWGMLDKALSIAKDSVAVKERFMLIDTLPYAYYQLAHIYVDLKQFDQAEIYYNKSIETANAIGGETFFKILSKMLLARCYIKRGQIRKTRDTAREAIKEAMEEGGYIEAICSMLMGIIFLQMRKITRAKTFIARGRELIETAKPKYFVTMLYGALAFIAIEDKDQASTLKYGLAYLENASSGNFIQMSISLYSMFSEVIKALPQEQLSFSHKAFIMELEDRCAKKPFVSKFFNTKKRIISSNYTILKALYDRKESLPFTANLFGNLTLTHQGAEVNLKGKISLKAREMLVYILHQGRAVTKDEWIEAIWPDTQSINRDDLFHATLYNLRKGLGMMDDTDDIIQYTNGTYTIKRDTFFCLHHLYGAMLPILINSEKLGEKEAELISQILSWYNYEYLHYVDSEWVGKSRAYYEMIFEKAAIKVSTYMMDRDAIKVSELLYRLLAFNPYSEEAHYLLIKVQIINGHHEAARHIYDDYANLIREELDILPSDDMMQLFS